MLLRTFQQLEWERKKTRRTRLAVDVGCGAGSDAVELLRRGWKVVAVDQQPKAVEILAERIPPVLRRSLTVQVAPMERFSFPKADLIYASFSLPFCPRRDFPGVWENIRRALVPGGHFAGQLFGNHDEWAGERPMVFHTLRQARALTRGYRVDMFRETEEEGMSFSGRKHWHFFDLILEKPMTRGG